MLALSEMQPRPKTVLAATTLTFQNLHSLSPPCHSTLPPPRPLTLPAPRSLPKKPSPGISESPSGRMFGSGNWGHTGMRSPTLTRSEGDGIQDLRLLNQRPRCPQILGFRARPAPPGPEGLTLARPARRRGSPPGLRRPTRARLGDPPGTAPSSRAAPLSSRLRDPPLPLTLRAPANLRDRERPGRDRTSCAERGARGGPSITPERPLPGAFSCLSVPWLAVKGDGVLSPGTTRHTWED